MKFILLLFLLTVNTISPKAQCWVSISSGTDHILGLKTDGSIWAWGLNGNGALGIGEIYSLVSIPTRIGSDTSWIAIAAGKFGPDSHSLGIKRNKTLWGWGPNFQGELGDGTIIKKWLPVQIGLDSDWIAVDAGYYHSVALKNDGTLWAWGSNEFGQLGDGTYSGKHTPVKIGNDNDWKLVKAGSHQTVAIKNDGTLWVWGGTFMNSNIPVQVGLSSNWKDISTSGGHFLAIKTDGTLWAWGYNDSGELGDGTNIASGIPIQIGSSSNWRSISAGWGFSHAVKSDGTLWAWGRNNEGQLGNGNNVNVNSPVQIGTLNNWVYISSGNAAAFSITNNNSLWSWGYNGNGQLGNGSFTNANLPAMLQCPVVTPLKWIYFNATPTAKYISLNWETNNEQNVKKIELERSADGYSFNTILSLPPKNTVFRNRYSAIDQQPLNGHNYYRLKSVDTDGKISYSIVVAAKFSSLENYISLFQNTANDFLIAKTSFKGENVKIIIRNFAGQTIERLEKPFAEQITIPIVNLKAGIYTITFLQTNYIYTTKFIKQRR